MIKGCILLLMLTLCSSWIIKKRIEDIFSLDADEAFASAIGEDLYAARKRLRSGSDSVNDTNYLMDFAPFNEKNATTTVPDISTTERIRIATIPPELSAKELNFTVRELKLRRVKLQLETVLNSNRTVADYIADSDIDTLTRKFDKIVENNKIKFHIKTRREVYDYYHKDDPALLDSKRYVKKRLRELMTHFVYITRYKLVYAQMLRQKYYNSPVYKIGFLFGLLRHLKNMQKWLFWALKTIGMDGKNIVGTMYYDLKLIEKLQRLDVDIKDVCLLIEKWEYRGNMESNPKYYDYSLEKYDDHFGEDI